MIRFVLLFYNHYVMLYLTYVYIKSFIERHQKKYDRRDISFEMYTFCIVRRGHNETFAQSTCTLYCVTSDHK